MPNRRLETWMLIGLVIGFVALATVYNIVTPVLEAPDEGAHVLYVYRLNQTGRLPDLEPGKFQAANESWQPPLYYLLGSLLTSGIEMDDLDEFEQWRNFHANGSTGGVNLYHHRDEIEGYPYHGSVLAIHLLRALSTVWGAVTILATWGIASVMLPDRPGIALIASAVTALNPQFLFMSGAVNNDIMVTAMCALTLWVLVKGWRHGMTWKVAVGLGISSGIAVLSKASALALLPLIGLASAVWAWRKRSWRSVWPFGLVFVGVWLAVSGWWFLHNWWHYGSPLAWDRMLMSAEGLLREQPLNLEDTLGHLLWLRRSYWGVFGYGVLLPAWVYIAFDVLGIVGILGWRVQLARVHPRSWLKGAGKEIALGLVIWFGLILVSLVRWMRILKATNQGRLIFPAVPSIVLGLVVGWQGWVRLWRPLRWLGFSALGGLALLAVLAPCLIIQPAYAHPQPLAPEAEATIPNRCVWSFGGQIELTGYTIPDSIKPGESLPVTLFWRGTVPMSVSYKVAVHVLGRDYRVVGGVDTIPYEGRFSTLLWRPGQVFKDTYQIAISEDAQPSLGRVFVSIYPNGEPGSPLRVNPSGEHHATLGKFKIAPTEPTEVSPPRPSLVSFGEQIVLLGTEVIPSSLRVGDTLPLVLYWHAQAKMCQDYTLFVHVLDEMNNIVAQMDGMPLEGQYPTSIWDEDETVRDERRVLLPNDLGTGEYRIMIGWYLLLTGERLAVVDDRGRQVPDRSLLLGTFRVD